MAGNMVWVNRIARQPSKTSRNFPIGLQSQATAFLKRAK
jgi:hypothetical protein